MATLTVSAKLSATVSGDTVTGDSTESYTLESPEFTQYADILTTDSGSDTNIGYGFIDLFNVSFVFLKNLSTTSGENISIKRNSVSFATLKPRMSMLFPVTLPATPGSISSGDIYVCRAATGSPRLQVTIFGLVE